MRILLVALMIVLLPLRGLVGDAMAMSLVGHVAQPSQPVAAAVGLPNHTAAPLACADHLGASAETGQPGHGGVCKACDVCHQASLANTAVPLSLAVRPGLIPGIAAQPFASADAAGSFKPPIL